MAWLQVRVEAEFRDAMKARCNELGVDLSGVVRDLLRVWALGGVNTAKAAVNTETSIQETVVNTPVNTLDHRNEVAAGIIAGVREKHRPTNRMSAPLTEEIHPQCPTCATDLVKSADSRGRVVLACPRCAV